ncbi:leucine-rich repeat and calponin homology domain-containing protein 4-like isoform X3 [Carcharodon carcharias]|uniref:leucine-rich repeat and calponin homology domain-containing protein 4-like isoform X3 n=1 Tax=Carcharodon carcharias TaxID=13397 RepID=UPI001B7E2769|nr:leucine-rich repeat and calponin homology domain-containing protein 4-like isoform X3 [Carcharodon carcharias]
MATGDEPQPSGSAVANLSRSVEKALEEAVSNGILNLSNRKLREFPRAATNYDLSDLIQADLSKNRLSEIPCEVCQYISLETLNLYHNCVRNIPSTITNLQALTYLNVSRSQLCVLPPYLCCLPLKVLIASNNKLTSLPEDIGCLRQLRELDVSCNEIQILPSQIGNLESLRDLNVRRNQLVTLPEEISELPLVRLDFSCNKVTRIPVCYRHLRHLQNILLDNNPLQSPPAQICTKGKIHIFKYLNIEACKTVPDLSDLDRSIRPQGFSSCLSDEFCGSRQHSGLDSGFNSVDSGSKRWSGNESTDEFTDLSLRMVEISREQRQLREARLAPSDNSATVDQDLEQIDFIDSSVNGEEEEDVKSETDTSVPSKCPRAHHSLEDSKRKKSWSEKSSLTDRLPHNGVSSGNSAGSQTQPRSESCPVNLSSSLSTTADRPDAPSNPSSLPTTLKEPGPVSRPNSFLFRSSTRSNLKSNSAVSPVSPQSPNYTFPEFPVDLKPAVRQRNTEQETSEQELIAQLRKSIESRLNRALPEDLSEALNNGVTLCQLVNQIRPRSISIIHIPSPAVPKLSLAKSRRNVESFLEACRKIGVPQLDLCLPSDILLGKVHRLRGTVEVLLEHADTPQTSLVHQLAGFSAFYVLLMLLLYLLYCHVPAF